MAGDPDLQRFVDAQDEVIDEVIKELEAGQKQSHWMWFVFPQIAGLGTSPMASRFAITGLDHARRFMAHPVLGPRLRHTLGLVLEHTGKTAREIFGSPDDLKFRSSLTLFVKAAADPEDIQLMSLALDQFYSGKADQRTLEILRHL